MLRIFLVTLTLCSFSLHARPSSGFYANPEVDELRIEIDDLKFALHAAQVELGLLDERVKKDQGAKARPDPFSAQLSSLEKKVSALEQLVNKVTQDLRTLNASIQGMENNLSSHDKRLEEVSKLKGTLTSISQAIGKKEETVSSSNSYQVKAGDSLEKIARQHKVSVDSLRKINNLSNDKIVIGQHLRIP